MNSEEEVDQLKSTIIANLLIFMMISAVFEASRHIKRIYSPRRTKKLVEEGRVPLAPMSNGYPLYWLVVLSTVTEKDFLSMVGLDAYMFLRYIKLCIRISVFFSSMGLIFLVPIYNTAIGDEDSAWARYTLANVKDDPNATRLWTPVIFAYVFAAVFCHMFGSEYKHFMEKRLEFFESGDTDTPKQTYHTVMLNQIPKDLRSQQSLKEFFEKVLPDQVHSIQLSYELSELEAACAKRIVIRDQLEASVALWKGSKNRSERPRTIQWPWNKAQTICPMKTTKICCDLIEKLDYDTIDYWANLMTKSNDEVIDLQTKFYSQLIAHEQQPVTGYVEAEFRKAMATLNIPTNILDIKFRKFQQELEEVTEAQEQAFKNNEHSRDEAAAAKNGSDDYSVTSETGLTKNLLENESMTTGSEQVAAFHIGNTSSGETFSDIDNPALDSSNEYTPNQDGANEKKQLTTIIGKAAGNLAKEGAITGMSAFNGILAGAQTVFRDLELVTFGAYYKTSSTAFITFKTRVAASMANQMFLSADHYTIHTSPAPNPSDIIWGNAHVPITQIRARTNLADFSFNFAGLFWSAVISFITAISNLDSLSETYPWLKEYNDTWFYEIMNSYLASLLLIIVLAILPFIFDMSARWYEKLKLESEIQASIMKRYYFYQLINVFVSVGLGSVLTNIQQVIEKPEQIFNILGVAVPSFSIYFTNFIIVKTLTAVPLEMLRIWPLIQVTSLATILDEKKCSWRRLHSGIYEAPEMVYGWIYPSLLMILLIINIYCCIAPLLIPTATIYFVLIYYMYKYQLLYVYENKYQAGGESWFKLFEYSMFTLMGGMSTLVCYMAIRRSFLSGPFYCLIPLPALIYFYQKHCEDAYKLPSIAISLESAVRIDQQSTAETENPRKKRVVSVSMDEESETLRKSFTEGKLKTNKEMETEAFRDDLYKQPCLEEALLTPLPYRRLNANSRLYRIDLDSDKNGDGEVGSTKSGMHVTGQPNRDMPQHSANMENLESNNMGGSDDDMYVEDSAFKSRDSERELYADEDEEPSHVEEFMSDGASWKSISDYAESSSTPK